MCDLPGPGALGSVHAVRAHVHVLPVRPQSQKVPNLQTAVLCGSCVHLNAAIFVGSLQQAAPRVLHNFDPALVSMCVTQLFQWLSSFSESSVVRMSSV